MLQRFLLRSLKLIILLLILIGVIFFKKKTNYNVKVLTEIKSTNKLISVAGEYEYEYVDKNNKIKPAKKKIIKTKFDSFFVASKNKTIQKPSDFICPSNAFNKKSSKPLKEYQYKSNQREILIVLSKTNSKEAFLFNLQKIFSHSRIKFRITLTLTTQNENTPSLVIFESHHDYLNIRSISAFKDYFKTNKIGIIVFSRNNENDAEIEFNECHLNNDEFLNNFLKITKFNTHPIEINTTVKFNKEYKNLFYSKSTSKSILKCERNNRENTEEILFVDTIDNIHHVFICIELIDDIWLLKSLFIDSIHYITNGEIDIGLKRYVQIDIDDVFVSKMNPEDLEDLISLQNELSYKYFINNDYKIKFVIGFSGKKYQLANEFENLGDSLLISI